MKRALIGFLGVTVGIPVATVLYIIAWMIAVGIGMIIAGLVIYTFVGILRLFGV